MGFAVRSAQASWTRFRFRSVVPAAACAVTLSIASSSTTAVAQDTPVPSIISEISQGEAEIDRLNLEIGGLAESVNQALVDLHDAQSLAEQARRGASVARDRLNETQVDVERAQSELDEISRSAYRSSNGGGARVQANGDARKDSLDRQTYLRKESEGKRATLEELQRTRTQAANEESTLRQASKLAEERECAATTAESEARQTLQNSLSSLNEQLGLRDDAHENLSTAREALGELRPEAASETAAPQGANESEIPSGSATPVEETEQAAETLESAEASETADGETSVTPDAENTETPEPAAEETPVEETPVEESSETGESDANVSETAEIEVPAEASVTVEEAPAGPSRPVLGDLSNPDSVAAAVDAFAQAVGEAQPDHGVFDDPYSEGDREIASTPSSEEADNAVAAADEENGTSVAEVLPEVMDAAQATEEIRGAEQPAAATAREDQIEAVIARGESQIGTPYVWGGGDAQRPDHRYPRRCERAHGAGGL